MAVGSGALVQAQQIGPADDAETDDEITILREVDTPELSELDPATILELISDSFAELAGDVLARLPLIVVALVVFVALLVTVRLVISGTNRGMKRGNVDFTVRRLVTNLLRFFLLLLVILLSLAIAGVEIGAMLAALGLIGLGIALALQGILENLISGVMILVRKPYNQGEVIVTGDVEGFVEDIDLRVTTIRTYDGTLVLVPNADIFSSNLTNLSRRGTRRTTLHIGIDYRDDHDALRELLVPVLTDLEAVHPEPAPMVVMVGLGDSSVDFEIRYWTDADMRTVILTRDEALRASPSRPQA